MTPEKKKSLTMWVLYALLFLAVMLLQDVYLGRLKIAGVSLLLLPMVPGCCAMFTGAEKGGMFAMAAGLFWAVTGGADGGVMLMAMTVSAVLCGYLCAAVFTRQAWAAVILCLMTLAITLLATGLVRAYMEGISLWSLRLGLRQILLSIPLSPVIYGAARLIRKAGA